MKDGFNTYTDLMYMYIRSINIGQQSTDQSISIIGNNRLADNTTLTRFGFNAKSMINEYIT